MFYERFYFYISYNFPKQTPRNSKPKLKAKKSEPSNNIKLLAKSQTDEVDDQDSDISSSVTPIPKIQNGSKVDFVIIFKIIGVIITLCGGAFGLISGYVWIKEDITKDFRVEVQAIKCAQNEIFKCNISKCSPKELLEKHSDCFNK